MPLPTYYTSDYAYTIKVPEADIDSATYEASRHIDSVTFNRIIGKGYDNLTDFQKEMLSMVCAKQAEFEHENADMLQNVLSSYSINGVSVNLEINSWKLVIQNGVVMQSSTYDMLKQTGLCCRSLGVR